MRDAADSYILAHYRQRQLRDIAAALGWPYERVQRRWSKLVRKGLADPCGRAYHRPWSETELAWLLDRVGTTGWTLDLIADKLGRSRNAVEIKLQRLRIRKPVTGRTEKTLRLRDVIAALGLGGNHRRVRDWIKSGKLKAGRAPARGKKTWRLDQNMFDQVCWACRIWKQKPALDSLTMHWGAIISAEARRSWNVLEKALFDIRDGREVTPLPETVRPDAAELEALRRRLELAEGRCRAAARAIRNYWDGDGSIKKLLQMRDELEAAEYEEAA